MSIHKDDINDSLYSLPDDDRPLYSIDDSHHDRSRSADYEVDEYDLDEEDEDEIEDDDAQPASEEIAKAEKRLSPWQILVKTMLTPVEGWKALKRARFRTEELASGCFYPLVALAAFSDVTMLFYEANTTVGEWVLAGLCTFITYFFGYFTVLLLGAVVLPRKSRDLLKKDIGRQMVMLSMSTLPIFNTFINIIPMLEPVLVFLPLWTIYLIYKGVRVIRVNPEVENSTTGLMCMLIIGAPLLWNWLISELLLPAV